MSSLGISLASDALTTGLSLLTQHSARVKDAKNENSAAQSAIDSQVADIQQVGTALANGTINVSDAITFCEQEDARIEAYLKSQVGKPGTAWDGTGTCGKTCTAGCCIYYGYIHGGFNNTIAALQKLQQTGQPQTWNYVAIDANKYGLRGRQAFSVTFHSPAIGSTSSLVNSVSSSLSSVVSSVVPGSKLSLSTIVLIIGFIALVVILGRK